MEGLWSVGRVSTVAAGLLALLVCSRPVQAELYVAGQGGYTLPHDLTNVQGVGALAGVSVSDLQQHDSVVYGGKVGYYFPRVQWLGVETEVFNATPHVKQQPVTVLGATSTAPGFDLRILTWATNVLVRYPGKQWQPYGGVGIGVFFVRASFAGLSDNDNAVPGLNALAGLRYFPTTHVAVFAEYKYNRATFDFPTAIGFEADYSTSHFLGASPTISRTLAT